ncbi:MAG: hypothetical protein AVDCRST_MAG67-84, partial [uncultured Solirubrobacteraceae bacterium]
WVAATATSRGRGLRSGATQRRAALISVLESSRPAQSTAAVAS